MEANTEIQSAEAFGFPPDAFTSGYIQIDHTTPVTFTMSKGFIQRRQIWVTFQKEGIHKYPAALTDPKLAEVSFLGHPHRHQFHFKVAVDVTHNDRDIEFILFKRELEALYDDKTLQLDYKSCEMMAEDLIGYISNKYPNRGIVVDVSEDGENGCSLTWAPVYWSN